MTFARICRGLAIVIALAGVLDPVVTTSQRVEPVISVIDTPQDAALADRAAARLDGRFTVSRRLVPSAAAVISVGDWLPDDPEAVTAPVFAIVPATATPVVRITSIRAPRRAFRQTRIPLVVSVGVQGAEGRTVTVAAHVGPEVDRATRKIAGASETADISVTLIPPADGPAIARVTATIEGTNTVAAADVLVPIDDRKWPVLFFDARPSWMSTFVRRSLEDDPRFSIDVRSLTSRTAATQTPNAPALADPVALARYAAIVIGAPDELSRRDVDTIEQYARARGGALVLLLDSAPSDRAGQTLRPLLGVSEWTPRTDVSPRTIRSQESDASLQAADVVWPAQLPPASEVIAAEHSGGHPIVWRTPVGAGRVIVGGALDSWRYRASDGSRFDEFWTQTIAAAAEASPDPIEITFDRSVVAPGTRVRARAVLREIALARSAAATTTVSAFIEGPTGRSRQRMWPSSAPGELDADLPAMSTPGLYHLTVSDGGHSATAEWLVAADARAPRPDERALLQAWARSRGGELLTSDRLDDLPDALDRVIRPATRDMPHHPTPRPSWIAPFTLLLGAEWWLRRRAGRS